jgi:hypothetical protein
MLIINNFDDYNITTDFKDILLRDCDIVKMDEKN